MIYQRVIMFEMLTPVIIVCSYILSQAVGEDRPSLEAIPLCTDSALEYQGYTYVTQGDGQRAWSHCKFFHPDTEPALCGMSKVWNDVYICDPDDILFSDITNSTYGELSITDMEKSVDLSIHQREM